jgi:fructokinase
MSADATTEIIISDMKDWKVDCKWMSSDDEGSTPVIVHKISKNRAGQPTHRFSWRCSGCGRRFPAYKPVLATAAEAIAEKIDKVDAFVFDRVSRGSIILAKKCADKGAVVVFEPSGISHPGLFQEACNLAHIIKYSHERLEEIPAELDHSRALRLQIETMGDEGLRYRWRKSKHGFDDWVGLDAFTVTNVVDSAGAGDWTTAGIVSLCGKGGVKGFDRLSRSTIQDAMRYGQALAAWTCSFEGARGGMYSISKKTFLSQVKRIIAGEEANRGKLIPMKRSGIGASSICVGCGTSQKKMRRHGKTG